MAKRSATGTKTDTPIIETPQSISVVGAEEIETLKAQSIQDTLGYVAGVSRFEGLSRVQDTIYLRGFEKDGNRYWAQTNSRFGQLTFFTGIASDGEAWVGYTRRVGWTTINRFSSSGGSSAKFTCSRITGC